MKIQHDFELLRDEYIREIETRARLYRHIRTGTELLSLTNNDENKVFGITFRTPAADSTGLPHIMEHSVLCGSRKYPVKEPFVEILKGSLKTFLNACTYPDKTCYPVASQNTQDFYNLIDVYLDAVFYPDISPFIFQQEGWHYEMETGEAPLTRKGVVFNEMKGAYSSPRRLLSEYSQQSIFPDNAYGFDAGGEPGTIPSLQYEQFTSYHRRYYHPSNARIFFYGDDDPDRRLFLVNEYLRDFDRLEVESKVTLQLPFDRPRQMVRSFASGEGEAGTGKGMVTVNWLLTETVDVTTNMALHVLSYILLGMPGSPLRKALIDSGLGEDLAGAELEDELRQMYFSVGLKGIDTKNAPRVEALIVETIAGLVEKGIDPHTVEAALNTVEFRLRENNSGGFPQGLVLMLRSLTTWLYDYDPLVLLKFEDLLAEVKAGLKENPRFFEDLMDRSFLENSHRTTVVLKPDPDLGVRDEQKEMDALAEIKRSMGDEEIEGVIENVGKLKELQAMPDSPEALAKIPVLKRTDLDRKNKTIPLDRFDEGGTTILYHNLGTNGIVYMDVGFDLGALPQEYIPYVSLFGRALLQMGTEKEDYVKLSERISRKTGGIQPASFVSIVRNSSDTASWLFLRGKAMQDQVDELLCIEKEVLMLPRFDNRERFRQMVLEEKARQEQMLVPGGHQLVNVRLRAHFTESGWLNEQMGGISYLFFLRELAKKVDDDWNSVCSVLRDMLRILVNGDNMIINATIDDERWEGVLPFLRGFLRELPRGKRDKKKWVPRPPDPFEGFTIPAQVNYVGKGANLYQLGYTCHGSAQVVSHYLRTTWLWNRVRVQGGAYGAFSIFDSLSGVMTFVSYRDPNIVETIGVFDETARYLRQLDLTDDELSKGIIGTIGDMDAHMLPDAKGYTSLLRYLNGNDDEYRQRIRDEVLSTTVDDFRKFADALEQVREKGLIKVLGSEGAIRGAVKEHGVPLKIVALL